MLGYPQILLRVHRYLISWFPRALNVTKCFKVCRAVGGRVIKFLCVKLFKLCSMDEPSKWLRCKPRLCIIAYTDLDNGTMIKNQIALNRLIRTICKNSGASSPETLKFVLLNSTGNNQTFVFNLGITIKIWARLQSNLCSIPISGINFILSRNLDYPCDLPCLLHNG
jgi:hypothetical protein